MSEKKIAKDIENLEQALKEFAHLKKGETPPDIKEKCLKLCKKFLAGIWIKQSVDDIEVICLMGGLTNQLFICKINVQNEDNNEAQEVVIRLNGNKYDIFKTFDENNPRINDNIIALIMSDNKIGPKVYGLSESGQILHYYKHRRFNANDLNSNEFGDQLAKQLARIHSLNPPIDRDRNWILDSFNSFKQKFNKNFLNNEKNLFKKYDCNELLGLDFEAEIEWIVDCIQNTDSKVVFCHNDFAFHNILVTESHGIVLCDFDFSYFGYRGYDLGYLFCYTNSNEFPEDVMKTFITRYIKQCEQICGKEFSNDPNNSVDHVLGETKTFLVISLMFLSLLLILKRFEIPVDEKTLMNISNDNIKKYLTFKTQLTQKPK